ncbi:uncharacterized protein A1O9_01712 [Exophiala aquamarina CBS 119918]|uniref:Nephrocystin 3-like N-terminal domain-containing protein n=1 Tax=Exophiala aquamarina CBS 119918 TaxID=1182545 RepID=A0A072PUH6_9EURO|nr:uncharacterized protein A1O9_01712 [Exophiala aquamarina CBS 119918]KEF63734.1 hypothetical protein A1O9_01712 [Exophiala aquamarina CBS 119918]
MCLQTFSHKHKLQRHIACHLESNALIALPPEEDVESDSDKNSSLESHVANRRRHLPALSATNDFPDDLGEPASFHENEADSTYLPAATVPLTRRALQEVRHLDPQYIRAAGFNEATMEPEVIISCWTKLMKLGWVVIIRHSLIIYDGSIGLLNLKSHIGGDEDLRSKALYDRLGAFDFSVHQKDLSSRREEEPGHLVVPPSERWDWHTCPPGSGKTFIASLVVDCLCAKYKSNPSVAVAYVYFDISKRNEQNPLDILKSLLKQLLQGLPSLPGGFIRALRASELLSTIAELQGRTKLNFFTTLWDNSSIYA